MLIEANKPITAEAIKNSLLGLSKQSKSLFDLFEQHNKKVKELIGKDFAEGTFERYETVYKHLKEFVKKSTGKDEALLSDVDHTFIHEFDHYLRTIRSCSNNTSPRR